MDSDVVQVISLGSEDTLLSIPLNGFSRTLWLGGGGVALPAFNSIEWIL
jgi:hypothetical protein